MEALSMLPQSLWVLWALFMLISRALYSWYFPSLLALTFFLISFWWNWLSLEERYLKEMSPLELNIPKIVTVCLISGYGSLHLFLHAAGGSFSEDDCSRHWSTRIVKYQWVNSFIFFYTSIVVFLPLIPSLTSLRLLVNWTVPSLGSLSWSRS